MPIDQFTRAEFESQLPRHKVTGDQLYTSLGFNEGQWVYYFPVTPHIGLKLYSGIDEHGVSAGCGKDSIRVIIIRLSDGKVYGSKLQRWITRQHGWAERLTGLLRAMWKMALRCGPCKQPTYLETEGYGGGTIGGNVPCGGFWGVYRVNKPGVNKGRLFRKCDGACSGWEWLTAGKEETKR